MLPYNTLSIVPFQVEDQETVKNLINTGLGEHWGYIDPDKNPDLDNIEESYNQDIFMVAWLDGQIVGTGALVHRTEHTAEIVRMSIAPSARRKGIGTCLLYTLITKAKELGYKKVVSETTKTWRGVINFYLAFGFEITFITADDIYFTYTL